MFLAFFPFSGINNLRVFNIAFSSIPTAPTKLLNDLDMCQFPFLGAIAREPVGVLGR